MLMRDFSRKQILCLLWLATLIGGLVLSGCAIDKLKLSLDRGVVSPKVTPNWIDTGSPTNIP